MPESKTMVELVLEEKQRFIPESGFNVVAVDTFAMPGEALYSVGHADTQEAAEARQQEYQQENPDTPVYIYPAAQQEQVQKSFKDFVAPIVAKDDAVYEKVKRILVAKHGYKMRDFDKGGGLFGMSTNELLDILAGG